jgi:tRNA pseudouridine38-40 synthase
MRSLRLTIAYDGRDFAGWQLQANARSVQGAVEQALLRLCGVPLRPVAAGRTDSGVHAAGQVLSLQLPDGLALPVKAFVHGLNRLLPEDVAVLDAAEAAVGFDARREASTKIYRYRILNRSTRHPLLRRTHWLVHPALAIPPMRAAAAKLVGRHDFAAFRASDCQAKTTVRRIDRFTLEAGEPDEWIFEVEGTAFLKHMVRNLVGTLVEVGRGHRAADDIDVLIASRDRRKAGRTAPAHGLTLVAVKYASLLTEPGHADGRGDAEVHSSPVTEKI